MRTWTARRWGAAAGGTALVALAIGLPTDIIPNPVFGRMIEVQWWNYPVLAVTAILGGLLLATYVAGDGSTTASRRGGIGGLLAFLAVGCPTCNTLVVLALGTSGALSWFAPAQPVLALLAIGLLAGALRARLRGEKACEVPAQPVGRPSR